MEERTPPNSTQKSGVERTCLHQVQEKALTWGDISFITVGALHKAHQGGIRYKDLRSAKKVTQIFGECWQSRGGGGQPA